MNWKSETESLKKPSVSYIKFLTYKLQEKINAYKTIVLMILPLQNRIRDDIPACFTQPPRLYYQYHFHITLKVYWSNLIITLKSSRLLVPNAWGLREEDTSIEGNKRCW